MRRQVGSPTDFLTRLCQPAGRRGSTMGCLRAGAVATPLELRPFEFDSGVDDVILLLLAICFVGLSSTFGENLVKPTHCYELRA